MTVTVTEQGAAAVVTLRWTATRNAVGPDQADELAAAVVQAGRSARGAVVVTGEGAFSAGGDLGAIADYAGSHTPAEIADSVYKRFQGVMRVLRECEVPTIAAIDGAAIGFGLDLALACDIRFIGRSGWVQQGWARAGLIAGTGGVGFLARLRTSALWELLGREDRIGPAECARLGIALTAEERALDAAIERAGRLARVPRDVLGHYAQLDRAENWPADGHFTDSARIQGGLLASERFRAFADKVLGRTEQ